MVQPRLCRPAAPVRCFVRRGLPHLLADCANPGDDIYRRARETVGRVDIRALALPDLLARAVHCGFRTGMGADFPIRTAWQYPALLPKILRVLFARERLGLFRRTQVSPLSYRAHPPPPGHPSAAGGAHAGRSLPVAKGARPACRLAPAAATGLARLFLRLLRKPGRRWATVLLRFLLLRLVSCPARSAPEEQVETIGAS